MESLEHAIVEGVVVGLLYILQGCLYYYFVIIHLSPVKYPYDRPGIYSLRSVNSTRSSI